MRPTTTLQLPTKKLQILLQLRSWVPFQRIQNFRLHSYFNLCSSAIEVYYQDIILNEIASDESHTSHSEIILVWKTSTTLAILYWSAYNRIQFWIHSTTFLKKMTPPMAFVMERSNYHGRRVLIHTVGGNGNWLRITEMLRNYFETRVRNLGITKPPLKPYW